MKIISAEFVTSAAAGGDASGIPRDGLPQIAMTGRSNVGKSTLLNALCRSKVARTSAAPGKTRLANIYRLVVEGGRPGKWGLYLVDLPGYGYARGGADSADELRAVAEAYFTAGRGLKTPAPQSPSGVGRSLQTPAVQSPSGVGRSLQTREVQSPSGVGRGLQTPAVQSPSGVGRGLQTPAVQSPSGVGRGLQTPAIADRGPTALLLVDSRHPGLESDIQAARWLSAMDVEYRVVATKIDKLSRSERARNLKALELTLGMPALPVSAASGEGMDTLWKTIASLARTGHE